LVKVKANQPTLLKAVKDTVEKFEAVSRLLVTRKNRGRKESRGVHYTVDYPHR
jgi:aspartate oxidase